MKKGGEQEKERRQTKKKKKERKDEEEEETSLCLNEMQQATMIRIWSPVLKYIKRFNTKNVKYLLLAF